MRQAYHLTLSHKKHSLWLVFFGSVCLLGVLSFLSLRLGAKGITSQRFWHALFSVANKTPESLFIWEIRLPRLLTAIIVGASLAQSGLIMQTLTQNDLADPSLLGVNAGSGLALVIGLLLFPGASYSMRFALCFIGAGLAATMIFGLMTKNHDHRNGARLIVSGMLITLFCQALGQGIGLISHTTSHIIGWQAGSLSQLSWAGLSLILPFILIGTGLLLLLAPPLSLFALGEMRSYHLGVRVTMVKGLGFVSVLFLAASSTALCGLITFIGLIAPNMAATIVPRHRFIPLAAMTSLIGAIGLVLADLISRTVFAPSELPVNLIMSLIGIPFFIWTIRQGGEL